MRKTLHRYLVKATDDAVVTDLTRWKTCAVVATRKEAWREARLLFSHHWRHVKVIEERRFSL